MNTTATDSTKTQQIAELRTLLSAGHTVHILFEKKDGSERDAKITRNLTNIPVEKHPKNVRKTEPKFIFAFDVNKADWICFHESQLIGFSPFIGLD
jgi:hypothetical protein